MVSLKPGVLAELLQNMDFDNETTSEGRSVPLQVISIIPALSGINDLSPSQGFYLKVSDSSHATYVSLPQEYDEMILSDKLQLGQLIHVQKLEYALPAPILRGVKPITGRHPCIGSPQDLVGTTNSLAFVTSPLSDQATKIKECNGIVRKPLEKQLSFSYSKTCTNPQRKELKIRSKPTSPINFFAKEDDLVKKTSDIIKEIKRISITCTNSDSDSDSSRSSYFVTPKSSRKSWNGVPLARVKERTSSQILKHETIPLARSQSAEIPRCQLAQNKPVSKDDNSSYMTMRKIGVERASKVFISSIKRKIGVMKKTCEENSDATAPSASVSGYHNDTNLTGSGFLGTSIPSTLAERGKEVLRHRDVALVAAVNALQEAAASERLLRGLSTYSELQAKKDLDQKTTVDRFLDLYDELMETRVIVQSLAKISPLRTSDSDPTDMESIREAVKVALHRKKSATLWIKAAIASDLSPFPSSTKSISESAKATTTNRKSGAITRSSKPKASHVIRKQIKDNELQTEEVTDKEESEWEKGGSSLLVAADLADTMQGSFRKWFLGFVGEFLDDVESKTMYTASQCQIAGVLCLLKRIDDWLGIISHKRGTSLKVGSALLEDEDAKACGRVRKKIYGILLKHVECAAVALETMSTTASEDSEIETGSI